MIFWPSHLFHKRGMLLGRPPYCLDRWIHQAHRVQERGLPAILTLGHLARLSGVSFGYLTQIVQRKRSGYSVLMVRKRGEPVRKRRICIPQPDLMRVQRWIARNVLNQIPVHPRCFSYKPNGRNGVLECATLHCGARWLVKIDIQDFFEYISEQDVYRVFHEAGYSPLVSFELTRICTAVYGPRFYRRRLVPERTDNLQSTSRYTYALALKAISTTRQNQGIGVQPQSVEPHEFTPENSQQRMDSSTRYQHVRWLFPAHRKRAFPHPVGAEGGIGHVPQGAPTSPMLSNLVLRRFDLQAHRIANEFGLEYSRYCDDLIFSSRAVELGASVPGQIVKRIYGLLRVFGFHPSYRKTVVARPGSRKVVLGLLVDGDRPRLSKAFRSRLHQHLHFMERAPDGVQRHRGVRGFRSDQGLLRHVDGLITYAEAIEPERAIAYRARFDHIRAELRRHE